ncbi:uncharacterized protein LOC131244056 [Magnolia sinica]|uniref:uncharacterized protein LOC131244056 n=1 Tax=Magnolia sinica TaxID=86752 RepID=UPI0026583504|nr:uncharacterized protein LOC131244056 [Magnolia sinica]
MDRRPEELQFLGFFGIYKESYKIVLTWRKVFSKITLALVLPLSFIFLAHIQLSELIGTKIDTSEDALDNTKPGSPKQNEILHRIWSEWTAYLLIKVAYFVFVIIFALLSTSAVVYTIACIYTAKDLTFKKVMSVVPKVWKRLMITFLWTVLILLGYSTLTVMVMIFFIFLMGIGMATLMVLIIVFTLYFIGFAYIIVLWNLASVVSVLEDVHGIAAMEKSNALIKGKAWTTTAIFLKSQIAVMSISILFQKLVVHGESLGLTARVGFGILFFMLLVKLILFSLVIQTVFYFVCKSYHNQSIDKSCLADHLEVYWGEYVPLNSKAVQLEPLYV